MLSAMTHYFTFTTFAGRLLMSALIVIALLAIVGITIGIKRRDLLPRFFACALGILVAYALVVIAICFSGELREARDDGTYQRYQTILGIAFCVIVVLFLLLALTSKDKMRGTKPIVYGAIMIAMSFAFSYIRLFKLPFGGSITFASILPLLLYSYFFGVKRGVTAGLIYGILQAVQDPWIVHPVQFILDYPLAFAVLGFAGVFRGKIHLNTPHVQTVELVLGGAFVVLCRYLCHAVSGMVFFGSYGADYGIGSAVAWGFLYNTFAIADGAIAIIVCVLLLRSAVIKKELARIANGSGGASQDMDSTAN